MLPSIHLNLVPLLRTLLPVSSLFMKTSPGSVRHLLLAGLYFGLAFVFSLSFYDRFWLWRHEIEEVRSSYITPDGSNITSAGMFWAVPAVLFFLSGARRMIRFFQG